MSIVFTADLAYYRHQEEALDFMLQRENGPIPPVFSLWKPLDGEEGWCVVSF